MPQLRGFIAIDIDGFPKLIEFEKEIAETRANVKLVDPENVHVTLKFLGDTNEEQIDEIERMMKDAVKEIDSFYIRLKGAGVFPNQNYIRVVWIGIEHGGEIGTIAHRIDDQLSKLGFKKEKREFSPHLTIARVKTAENKEKLLQIIEKYREVEFADMKIDSIKLKKSDLTQKGPIYTTLREIKI